MEKALQTTEYEENLGRVRLMLCKLGPPPIRGDHDALETSAYHVDEDGTENSAGDGLAIIGIFYTSDKLLMPASIQRRNNAEDDDGEDGDDSA